MRKIIIKQHQSPGDVLTITRTVADIKHTYPDWLIDVRTPCPEIWENNPHITPLKDDEAELIWLKNDDEIHECGWRQEHWTDAFRHEAEKKLGCTIKKTSILPELYISDQEKNWYNQIHCEFGYDGPYWIINAGRKQDNELKQYHRWPEVVDILNNYFAGRVKIVQIGHKDHVHPKLRGVLNLIGKTDMRQLIRLMYWASGSIGPLSLQFVISAALKQPAVCVAGGKEDVRWHLYPHIRYIYTNGAMKCCEWGGCWRGGKIGDCLDIVGSVPRCFNLIKPSMIADAVKMYYLGGMKDFEHR